MGIMENLEGYQFIFFLTWLVEEHNFNATEIIGVVEKPYQYREKWAKYIESEEE
mgnify:FL=1